jgi:type IV pilus assembly protein PilN
MRISVNLATRPFVELRPFFLRLRIVMAVLAVLGVVAVVATHMMQKKLDIAAAQLNAVHVKVVAAQQEKQGNERRMREPANAAVLTRAHFLNALFLRKSFSWTAVMMDLETVLPSGVQVTSIEPEPTSDGDVMIRLRVSGDRDRAVQLVRNLERSKRFLAPRLTGEATQAKEAGSQSNNAAANAAAANNGPPPGVEFEILANYNPLPEGETYSTDKAGKNAAKNGKTSATTKPAGAKAGSAKAVGSKAGSAKAGAKHHAATPKPSAGTPAKPAKGGAR